MNRIYLVDREEPSIQRTNIEPVWSTARTSWLDPSPPKPTWISRPGVSPTVVRDGRAARWTLRLILLAAVAGLVLRAAFGLLYWVGKPLTHDEREYLALARSDSLFNDDEQLAQLRKIRKWSKDTADGSLSDLTFRPLGPVWDEVASDSGNCLGRRCPTHAKCFYFQNRRRVQNAPPPATRRLPWTEEPRVW